MNKYLSSALTVLVLISISTTTAETFKVYYLGGQSNMVGFGYNRSLPAELIAPVDEVPTFSGAPRVDEEPIGGDGAWTKMQPGFGLGSDFVDGEYILSDRFGPEITFVDEMKKLAPNERFAIVKYAWGGTALMDGVSGYGSWDPSVKKLNQYDYFLKVVRDAMGECDIDGDGEADTLIPAGIIWMQGEADAFESLHAANAYKENLANLTSLMRAAFHDKDLPIVIGRITDSRKGREKTVMKYSETVRKAQEAFTEEDEHSVLSIVTEKCKYGEDDEWHYLTEGYMLMGRDFARKIHSLQAD